MKSTIELDRVKILLVRKKINGGQGVPGQHTRLENPTQRRGAHRTIHQAVLIQESC